MTPTVQRETDGTTVVKPSHFVSDLNAIPTDDPVSPLPSSPHPPLQSRNTSWFGNFGRTRSVTSPSKLNVVHTPLPTQNVTPPGVTAEVYENRSSASLPTRINISATDKNEESPSPQSAPSSSLPKALEQLTVPPISTASCDIFKELDDTVLQLSPHLDSPSPTILPNSALSRRLEEPPEESSSLHNEVPVVNVSPTLPPISTQGRFTIAIPFFGRAKVPLAAVLDKVGKDNEVDGYSVAQIADPMDIGRFPYTCHFQKRLNKCLLFQILQIHRSR